MGQIPVKRIVERFYPIALALVGGVVSYHYGLKFEDSKYSNQLSSTINVSAILMGFLGTAQAMLLSFNSKTFRAIRSNKHLWSMMLSYFRSALLGSMSLCVISLVLFSLDTTRFRSWQLANVHLEQFLMPIWVGLAIFAFFAFYRVVKVIFLLLNDPTAVSGNGS